MKELIGQKEKKAIVCMAVRALHNSKVFKIKETQSTMKHPCMKEQKVKELSGLKDKKAIVCISIKALHNVKAFRTQKAKKAKKQRITYRRKKSKKVDKKVAHAKKFSNAKDIMKKERVNIYFSPANQRLNVIWYF